MHRGVHYHFLKRVDIETEHSGGWALVHDGVHCIIRLPRRGNDEKDKQPALGHPVSPARAAALANL